MSDVMSNVWWCPRCGREVAPEDVTWECLHDDRCGGCGEQVLFLARRLGVGDVWECKKCMFSRSGLDRKLNQVVLTCHRYAPKPLVGGSGQGWSNWEWPQVEQDDFCGEFVLGEEK